MPRMGNSSSVASSPAAGDDVLFTRECHDWRADYSIASLGLVVSPGITCSGRNLHAIDARCGNADGERIKRPELIQWYKSSIVPGSSGFVLPARKDNSCSNIPP
jgi:hypothetical protein